MPSRLSERGVQPHEGELSEGVGGTFGRPSLTQPRGRDLDPALPSGCSGVTKSLGEAACDEDEVRDVVCSGSG